ncbi:MAG: GDSL-type esterase/lipase family protein [Saprospiraceae bacterium]
MRFILTVVFGSLFILLSVPSAFAQFEVDGYHMVDFGSPASEVPVNSITSTAAGTRLDIPATNGCDNFLEVVIVDDFSGVNNSGTQQADPSLNFPPSLSGDSFFGHTGMFNGVTNPTAAIEVRGIPSFSESVEFSLFASRIGSGNRQTCYTFYGQDTIQVCLDPNNNVDQVVEVTTGPIEIDSLGKGLVRIEMTAGPENDTPEGFFYLGGLTIRHGFSSVTNNHVHSFDPLCTTGRPVYEVGDQILISGYSYNPCNTYLGLFSGGVLVDTVPNAYLNFGFEWTVPNFVTSSARLGLVSFGPQGQVGSWASSQLFSIVEAGDPCTIVVLGSSTAAGTGPSTPDSTWVNRYRSSIVGCDTRLEVVNLARGGYNTFKLLPDDGFIPTGVMQTIDSTRNITAALALNPEAIIINLPSNDAASGYDVAQQLANYDQMLAAAGNVPVYITTPQPRNFSAAQVLVQQELLDSTFARFGARAIDFWTPFATGDGLLDPAYDSGDGVHMNDAAHRILWDSVLAKQIDTILSCRPVSSSVFTPRSIPQLSLKLSPNPTGSEAKLEFTLPQSARVEVSLFSLDGKLVRELPAIQGAAGDNEVSIRRDSLPVGVYVVRLAAISANGTKRAGTGKLIIK